MADLLDTAAAWLARMQRQYAATTVLYHRGALSVPVSATIGRTTFEVADDYGVLERYHSRDFLVPVEELLLGDRRVMPERGDRIQEMQDGVAFVYEVTAPGKDPPWRYSDLYRRTYRIHTKLISEDVSP
jgi:hypothetical protein